MKTEEVHFNHDPSSNVGDALTIRWNAGGQPIAPPEWRAGQSPKPAAYASAPLGATVTIKAKFSDGPAEGNVRIRAIDADLPIPSPGGCLGWLVELIAGLVRALFGNVLGEVAERNVSFAGGQSQLTSFSLSNHRLKTCGVGIHTTKWRWQYRHGMTWLDFDTTQHKIYVVLDVPQGPWRQSTGNETQLPWVDALEKACTWALGTTTKDDAAAAITRGVNTVGNVKYTPSTMFGWGADFELASYLAEVNGGQPFVMNCTDCADAVTTLANLLGCDLFEGRFNDMQTRRFLTLNGNPANQADWAPWGWSYHEICWLHQIGQNELIYDGCLQVDMDDDYADAIHVAKHPEKMRFGMNDPGDYRYRLVASGPATIEGTPRRRTVI
jgi:hypothetical protein